MAVRLSDAADATASTKNNDEDLTLKVIRDFFQLYVVEVQTLATANEFSGEKSYEILMILYRWAMANTTADGTLSCMKSDRQLQ